MSNTEISKRIGRLFITRCAINLRSELLGTPAYFWDMDQYETKYHTMMKYMDVPQRIVVVNTRLGMIQELLHLLSAKRENIEGTKLEWIVIVLILLDVLAVAIPEIIRLYR